MSGEPRAGQPAETVTVYVRGLAFELTAGGPPDGPPVLLLHGFPQHRGEWDLVTPALGAAGLRTYALDQRGYSPGARPSEVTDYAMAECVADALAVLDALGVDRAHVVGHDWGAIVGWHLAARHAARVRTLTAVSVPHPAALGAALRAGWGQRARSAYIKVFQRPRVAETILLGARGMVLRGMLRGVPADRIGRYLAPMREPGALTGALNWYRALKVRDVSALPPVAVPTTYLWSHGDGAIGDVAARLCERHVTGDYRFVTLGGVSHWVPDEAPEAVISAVQDRINAVER